MCLGLHTGISSSKLLVTFDLCSLTFYKRLNPWCSQLKHVIFICHCVYLFCSFIHSNIHSFALCFLCTWIDFCCHFIKYVVTVIFVQQSFESIGVIFLDVQLMMLDRKQFDPRISSDGLHWWCVNAYLLCCAVMWCPVWCHMLCCARLCYIFLKWLLGDVDVNCQLV